MGGEPSPLLDGKGQELGRQIVRMGMLIAPSTQQVLHVVDQDLCPLRPCDAIQAELLRFIVVSALHGKGGEGPQRQKLTHIHPGLLQQDKKTGDVVAVRWSDAQLV